jgi:hypothetical protein
MAKCPNCGAELPEPAHFGLKAHAKNYVTPPIPLKPGRKYLRRFSLLYYPPRTDPEYGMLSDCVVIASEEYSRDSEKSYPFIAGAKFYSDELGLLRRAAEDVLLAELGFTALTRGRRAETVLMDRLRELYYSPVKRAELGERLTAVVRQMQICRDVTAREETGAVKKSVEGKKEKTAKEEGAEK